MDAHDQQDIITDHYEDPAFAIRPTATRGGRPFCGHCNIPGHLQEGCWRLEGRSEEEITIIRRALSRDRAKRARMKSETKPNHEALNNMFSEPVIFANVPNISLLLVYWNS